MGPALDTGLEALFTVTPGLSADCSEPGDDMMSATEPVHVTSSLHLLLLLQLLQLFLSHISC